MNTQQRKFWVTCPQCRKAFGVEPRFVMKYLERIISQFRQRFNGLAELIESAQGGLAQRTDGTAKKDAAKKRAL
jgi:hypothetical protein